MPSKKVQDLSWRSFWRTQAHEKRGEFQSFIRMFLMLDPYNTQTLWWQLLFLPGSCFVRGIQALECVMSCVVAPMGAGKKYFSKQG